jgi:hypothetical protein
MSDHWCVLGVSAAETSYSDMEYAHPVWKERRGSR